MVTEDTIGEVPPRNPAMQRILDEEERAMRVGYLLSTWLIAILLVGLGGCSPSTVKFDYDETIDFSRYETYGWLEQTSGNTTLAVPVSQGFFQTARESADATMQKKGFRKVGAAPNMGLVIHVGAGKTIDVAAWGYSAGFEAGRGGSAVYAKGTLIIDIVDNRAKRLIWRGTASAVVNDAGQATSSIEQVVATVLGRFPPQ